MFTHSVETESARAGDAERVQSRPLIEPPRSSMQALANCLLEVAGVAALGGLNRICRLTHEHTRDVLVDDRSLICSGKTVRFSVYRSLRTMSKSEGRLRSEFIERVADGVVPATDVLEIRRISPCNGSTADLHRRADALVEAAADELNQLLCAKKIELARSIDPGDGRWADLIDAFVGPWAVFNAYAETMAKWRLDARVAVVLIQVMRDHLVAGMPMIYAAIGDAFAQAKSRMVADIDPCGLAATRDALLVQLDLEPGRYGGFEQRHTSADGAHGDPIEVVSSCLCDLPRDDDAADDHEPFGRDGRITSIATTTEGSASDALASLADAVLASVESDHEFPRSLADAFGRLRSEFVDAVRRDPASFIDRDGSARRLLNTIAASALARGRHAPGSDPAVRALRTSIENVCSMSRCDVDGFGPACDILLSDLRQAQNGRDALHARQITDDSEQAWAAWREVASFMEAELAGSTLPAVVHDLLRRPWAQYMVHLALRGGVDSVQYRNACSVATNLRLAFDDWATLPSRTPLMAQRTVQRLGEIALELGGGLSAVGYSTRQVSQVWRCLVDLTSDPHHAPSAPSAAIARTGHDVDSAIRAYGARRKATGGEAVVETTGGDQTSGSSALVCAGLRSRLRGNVVCNLKVGSTFQLRGEGNAPMVLKLCWRGIYSGKHVFVNRFGCKAMELSAEDVTRMLDCGSLVPSTSVRPVEHAVARLVNRFNLGTN